MHLVLHWVMDWQTVNKRGITAEGSKFPYLRALISDLNRHTRRQRWDITYMWGYHWVVDQK